MKIEKHELTPLCPHCEKKVEKLIEVQRGWYALNRVFCCPHCEKIVGIAAGT